MGSIAGTAPKGAAAGGSTQGRAYSGAEDDNFDSGRSAFTSLPSRIRKRSSGMVSPTMAKSRSHFTKIARASSSISGFSTISIRSWPDLFGGGNGRQGRLGHQVEP